jgi:septal ring factor EnvC (AmiA/AmiB activator)
MVPPNQTTPIVTHSAIESELVALERKQASLIAHTRALRAANEMLRRDLAAANARNHTLAERVAEARKRLDQLLARLPEPAE